MQLTECLLIGFYLLCAGTVLKVIYHFYQSNNFSFHLIFSGIYFVTFFLGFPISIVLQYGFEIPLWQPETVFLSLSTATIGYFIYLFSYQFLQQSGLWQVKSRRVAYSAELAKKRAKITACLLFLIVIGAVGYFISVNGLLLFRLEKYSQIFSSLVNAVALKRFFYFFLPALLIGYFLYPTRKNWWLFLTLGISFGVLTYFAVGGTRANMALALILFLLIGGLHRYLSFLWIFVITLSAIIVMFFLALIRYKLNVNGSEMYFTFLYLTRDTFSPWENLARIFSSDVTFQGLMPIIADFFVYIPKTIWTDRPDIVWNTANYFTKIVLGNESGLAISPTLLGSFYLMGGFPLIVLGMMLVSGLIYAIDCLFDYGRLYRNAFVQAYCLGNLFNLIVLVREGMDAFISRWLFFSGVFIFCWVLAFLFTQGRDNGRLK